MVAAGLAIRFWACAPPERDCATAAKRDSPGDAVVACQREYERTRHPATGALLANAFRRSNNTAAAAGLANDLLVTSARADALWLLGKIAADEGREDEAMRMLEEARKQHRAENRRREVARDAQTIAQIQSDRALYAEALDNLAECIEESRGSQSPVTEGYCQLAAARVLTKVGYLSPADEALALAARTLTSERDRASLEFERGNVAQNYDRAPKGGDGRARAVGHFMKALDHATKATLPDMALTIHMNLAYSLAQLDRTDEAEHHLARAAELDKERAHEIERTQLAARIEFRRKNYGLAYSTNERIYAVTKDLDDRLEIAVMQARIALAQSPPDPVAAERWARRGVDDAEKARTAQSVLELRSWVLASRREPLELLFTILARDGRAKDATAVFDQWQGRALQDALARPTTEPAAELRGAARHVRQLSQWLPASSTAPLLRGEPDRVIATLGTLDLVAFAVADQVVWRISTLGGTLQVERVAPYEDIRELVDDLWSKPTDPVPARALGEQLLSDAMFTPSAGRSDVLHVVLDKQLDDLPVSALRRADRPLVASRRVLHLPRLPASAVDCAPRAFSGSARVLADPQGDLRDAREEAGKIASLFDTTPLLGNQATSGALFSAKSAALLHVAAHGLAGPGGGVLSLYDRGVSAAEIAASGIAPSLVVLSACSAARSSDPEVSASLSSAFLGAGGGRVVATLRTVSDGGARELTARLYAERGADDPIGALARVQADFAARGGNADWPSFAVYGYQGCAPRRASPR